MRLEAPLDPDFAAERARLAALTRGWPDRYGVSFQEARRLLDRERALLEPDPPPLATVEDRRLGTLPARLYGGDGARGLVIYLHGGGWCVGGLASHDTICRRLALACGRWVLALDYPLAPEHPYPAARRAVATALRAPLPVPETARAGRPCLAGDSAGAALALEILLKDRALAARIGSLALLYGNFVFDCASDSHRRFGGGARGLSDRALRRYWAAYFAEPASAYRRRNLVARVGNGPLPSTLILAAGLDPLRDDSLCLADRLAALGRPADLIHAPGLPHGFLSYGARVPKVHAVFQAIGAWLARQSA